jgi:hypothetical protein
MTCSIEGSLLSWSFDEFEIEDEYYNYIYLDPRKPGKYHYGDMMVCFLYEPFYVGKGKGKRMYHHIYYAKKETQPPRDNEFKSRKIKKILNLGLEPFILKLNENSSDKFVKSQEIEFISSIGRSNKGKGPLTNLSDGGEGQTNFLVSSETRNKIGLIVKQQWASGERIATPAYKETAANNFRNYSKSLKGKCAEEIYGEDRGKLYREHFRGEKNPFYGKKHSDEMKMFLSLQKKEEHKNGVYDYAGAMNPASKQVEILLDGMFITKCDTGKDTSKYLNNHYKFPTSKYYLLMRGENIQWNNKNYTIKLISGRLYKCEITTLKDINHK